MQKGEERLGGCSGYLFADVGSGYYLGQQALTAIFNAYEGRGEKTALIEPVRRSMQSFLSLDQDHTLISSIDLLMQ